jgi:hypothetical protein
MEIASAPGVNGIERQARVRVCARPWCRSDFPKVISDN